MSQRAEFANLAGSNREWVEQHQWPPVAYLKELEDYERKADAHRCKNKRSDAPEVKVAAVDVSAEAVQQSKVIDLVGGVEPRKQQLASAGRTKEKCALM